MRTRVRSLAPWPWTRKDARVKYPCLLRAFAALIVILSQSGCGQQSAPTAPPGGDSVDNRIAAANARLRAAKWNVRVDVMIVEVPEARALELLPDLRSDDPQKISAAVTQIQQMIAAKEATLIGWPEVITLDGDRAVSETSDEKRYPVEFGIPGAPSPEATGTPAAAAPAAPASTPQNSVVDADLSALSPSAFETRNVGLTLEVEPHVLDEGRRLVIQIVPQHVLLLGYEPFDAGRDDTGRQLFVEQPQFATRKTTTSVSIRNGQHVLLSLHKIDGEEPKMELFILHAVATKVE